MTSKNTKRALLTSALSILMCVSMLIGTTFAWFTDTATTNVNKIQSGTLDVALEMWNGTEWVNAEGETLNFKAADGRTDILWEPGCTYELPTLRIVNKGNLALKYQVYISGINGDAKLNEAIEWKSSAMFANGTYTYPEDMVGNTLINGVMYPDEIASDSDWMPASGTFKIIGHMKEDAGNEYQGLTIEGISITVVATQAQHENDIYGNQYDANAQYPQYVTNQATLEDVIKSDADEISIALPAGTYTIPSVTQKKINISGTKSTVIDMTKSTALSAGTATQGLDITFDNVTVKFSETDDYKGIQHSAKVTYKNCVLEGKQFLYAENVEFINCTFKNSNDYAVWTYGAENVVFDGCTFLSGGKAILIYTESSNYSGNVTVRNCAFYDDGTLDTVKAAIEIGDSQPTAGLRVNLTVKDNIVVGFAHNNEGFATGSKLWGNKNSIPTERLIVTAENNFEYDYAVSTAAELAAALATGGNVVLTNDIDVNNAWLTAVVSNRSLTLDGNGHTIKNLNKPLLNLYGGTFKINNLTVESSVVSANDSQLGAGVIVEEAQWANLYMDNCHVKNCKLTGGDTRAAALVGYWVGGGEIKNSTVDNFTAFANGSVAGVVGHRAAQSGYVADAKITNCTVKNSNIRAQDDGWRIGTAIGTVAGNNTVITNFTESANTLEQLKNDFTAETNPNHSVYGRISGGSLTVDGTAQH